MNIENYVRALYGDIAISPCPFTDEELAELPESNEMLVYLPKELSARQLCDRFEIPINIDLSNERMIRTVMKDEDQWFLCSRSDHPELLYKTGQKARRTYEDEGLHGMDLRRYLAFVATFRYQFDRFPDMTYWTFLLSGSYDRSGVSLVGFDRFGVLSHHGWMKNFKAKFAGSRYIVIAPRIECTPTTQDLPRARRGGRRVDGLEAAMG